jgi:hypothetical protein
MRSKARIVGVSLLVLACGAAELPPKAGEPQRQNLTELDALEHDLNVSEQRLSAELERKRTEAVAAGPGLSKAAPAGEAESSQAAPNPAPEPARPTTAAPAPADEVEEAAPRSSTIGSACDLACRALASMRRSADGICSITGDADERCTSARSRVQARTTQVAQAGCLCRGP